MPDTLITQKKWDAQVSQAIADELHRRARRMVDRVVAEAMEQITGKRGNRQKIVFVARKR